MTTPTPASGASPAQKRGLLPQPALSLVLFASWLLAQNSISPGAIVMGALLGWVIPIFTARFWPDYPEVKSWFKLFRLMFVVLWDIVVASFQVALQVIGPPKKLKPHFINYPLALETDYAITLLASIISLTPGTVSSLVSNDKKTLIVHALHCPDEAAAIEDIRRRYEAPLKEIFE